MSSWLLSEFLDTPLSPVLDTVVVILCSFSVASGYWLKSAVHLPGNLGSNGDINVPLNFDVAHHLAEMNSRCGFEFLMNKRSQVLIRVDRNQIALDNEQYYTDALKEITSFYQRQ